MTKQANCATCGKQKPINEAHLPADCLAYLTRRLGRLERMLKGARVRVCGHCRKPMLGMSETARFCSASCRQGDYQRRKDSGRVCAWNSCGRSMAGEFQRKAYCSQACKSKAAYYTRKHRALANLLNPQVRELSV